MLTAHVAPTAAAPNNPVTGTIVFTDGNLALGSATLDANGNASITAKAAFVTGGDQLSGNATLGDTPLATGAPPAPDPYADVSIPSYSGCNQNSYSMFANQTVTTDRPPRRWRSPGPRALAGLSDFPLTSARLTAIYITVSYNRQPT